MLSVLHRQLECHSAIINSGVQCNSYPMQTPSKVILIVIFRKYIKMMFLGGINNTYMCANVRYLSLFSSCALRAWAQA